MKKHAVGVRLFAIILSGVVATLTLGALPVFIARISHSFDLSIQQSGFLAMSDLGGCAVGCVISLATQNRLGWHKVLVFAICVTCAGNLLSIDAADYLELLSSRFIAGLGNGFTVSLVFAALCATSNPDRNFGFYTFGQLIAQAITIPFFTSLISRFDIDAVFTSLTVASAATIVLVPLFPTAFAAASPYKTGEAPPHAIKNEAEQFEEHTLKRRRAILALAALGIYFWGFSSVWAFFETFATNANLSSGLIGRALGMASVIGILGPIMVVLSEPLIKRRTLLIIGLGTHMFSLLLLINAGDYAIYLASGSLFLFSLNFVFPFQMGVLAEFDVDGSMAVIALVVQLACLATGPYLGGIVHTHGGPGALVAFSAISFGIALALLLVVSTRPRRLIP